MAIKKEIKIIADTKDAQKDIEKVSDGVKNLDKANEGASKSAKGVGSSIKGIGGALKAIGIGLVIALFAKLAEVFSKNQKVVDFFSTAMESLSIVFNDFFNFVFDNFGKWVDSFKAMFEDPVQTLKDFGTAIKENLIERFESLLDTFGYLGQALKKLMDGDFKGAWDSVKDAGKESIDVFTGVNNTVDTVVDGVTKLVEKSSDYLKSTYKQAKANVELKNTAELATAQQARLVEQYDRLAEKQRQIRDDESISIKERQKANEELGRVLQEQEKSMIKLANLQIASAQANLNTNKSIENQVALTDALANKDAVLAQVEGFRSEQLVNSIALKKEQIELDNSISDAEKERQLAKLEFDEEQALTEEDKLIKQQERLDRENEIILEDLERKRELYAEGTQARVDAEQEFLNRKQEIDLEQEALDNENARKKKELDQSVADAKVAIGINTLQLLQDIAGKDSKIGKGLAVAQATISGIKGVQNAYTTAQESPITALMPAYPLIQAGLAGAFSALQIKKILSTDASGKSSGGGASSGGGVSAPSFNVVGGTGSNQITQSLNSADQPIQAYVVSGSVTSQQELDRNIESNASL